MYIRTYPISHIIVFHRGQLRISRGGSGVFFGKMYTFYMLLLFQLFVLVCFFFNGLMYLSMHLSIQTCFLPPRVKAFRT